MMKSIRAGARFLYPAGRQFGTAKTSLKIETVLAPEHKKLAFV